MRGGLEEEDKAWRGEVGWEWGLGERKRVCWGLLCCCPWHQKMTWEQRYLVGVGEGGAGGDADGFGGGVLANSFQLSWVELS